MKQAGTVDAILRAFAILEYLAETPEGSTVTELARREDVNKALTHRALSSLVAAGYIAENRATQQYRLTTRLLGIAMSYYDALGLRGVAGPIMQEVADATGCNAEFTRYLDGELRLLIWVAPRGRTSGVQIVGLAGDIQAPHATAAGKVWLASLSAEELDAFLVDRPLPRLGPRTIVDTTQLKEEIERVRGVGYATNRQEDSEGVIALAVPIRPPDDSELLGSLSLTRFIFASGGPSEGELVERAMAAAQSLGVVLPRGHESVGIGARLSF